MLSPHLGLGLPPKNPDPVSLSSGTREKYLNQEKEGDMHVVLLEIILLS